jgi:hypothetical protein
MTAIRCYRRELFGAKGTVWRANRRNGTVLGKRDRWTSDSGQTEWRQGWSSRFEALNRGPHGGAV